VSTTEDYCEIGGLPTAWCAHCQQIRFGPLGRVMDWTDPNWCPVCGTDATADDHPEVCAEKMRNWRPVGIVPSTGTRRITVRKVHRS
jgi:hypothetical protein